MLLSLMTKNGKHLLSVYLGVVQSPTRTSACTDIFPCMKYGLLPQLRINARTTISVKADIRPYTPDFKVQTYALLVALEFDSAPSSDCWTELTS